MNASPTLAAARTIEQSRLLDCVTAEVREPIGPHLQWAGTLALVLYGIGPNELLPESLVAWRRRMDQRLFDALRPLDDLVDASAYAATLRSSPNAVVWALPFVLLADRGGIPSGVVQGIRSTFGPSGQESVTHRDALLALAVAGIKSASNALADRTNALIAAIGSQVLLDEPSAYEVAHLVLYATRFGRRRDEVLVTDGFLRVLLDTAWEAIEGGRVDLAAELIAALAAADARGPDLVSLRRSLISETTRQGLLRLSSPTKPGFSPQAAFHEASTHLLAVGLRR